MLIPHTQLSPDTLDELITDYVTREGTDNGHFTTLDERKAQLRDKLGREEAFITYNHEYQQACLVTRHEVSAEALRDFQAIKQTLQEEAAASQAEAKDQAEFKELYGAMLKAGAFPIDLGRTVMSGATNAVVESGKLTLEQLQELLYRHSQGDYGVVGWGDKLRNLKSIKSKDYMLSRFELAGVHLYVEMLAGWHRTMVLLVSER